MPSAFNLWIDVKLDSWFISFNKRFLGYTLYIITSKSLSFII